MYIESFLCSPDKDRLVVIPCPIREANGGVTNKRAELVLFLLNGTTTGDEKTDSHHVRKSPLLPAQLEEKT